MLQHIETMFDGHQPECLVAETPGIRQQGKSFYSEANNRIVVEITQDLKNRSRTSSRAPEP
eukprot:7789608-Pyramimonas_sp.AAC.1